MSSWPPRYTIYTEMRRLAHILSQQLALADRIAGKAIRLIVEDPKIREKPSIGIAMRRTCVASSKTSK